MLHATPAGNTKESIYFVFYSVFIGVSDRGNIRRLKESNRINEDLQSYRDWMKRAGMHTI